MNVLCYCMLYQYIKKSISNIYYSFAKNALDLLMQILLFKLKAWLLPSLCKVSFYTFEFALAIPSILCKFHPLKFSGLCWLLSWLSYRIYSWYLYPRCLLTPCIKMFDVGGLTIFIRILLYSSHWMYWVVRLTYFDKSWGCVCFGVSISC